MVDTIKNSAGHKVKMQTCPYSDGSTSRIAKEYDENGKYLKSTHFWGKGTSETEVPIKGTNFVKKYFCENNKITYSTDNQKGATIFYNKGVPVDTIYSNTPHD